MADISLQFHAVPEELLSLIKQCVNELQIHVVGFRFFPFDAAEISASELDSAIAEFSPIEQIAFTLRKPKLPATGQTDFLEKNPNSLLLSIERVDREGLRQSGLSARTDDPKSLAIWKSIATRVKNITKVGAVVINPDTGDSGYERTFRYTAGAEALQKSGVVILPLAGDCIIKLGKPAEDAKTPQQRRG